MCIRDRCKRVSSRPVASISTPVAAKSIAMAFPIPLEEPVINASLADSVISIVLSCKLSSSHLTEFIGKLTAIYMTL